ncbi:hypothetical protein JB92DRAFT_476024 [Gautieria morchelliformis]|nr:hypothetical protein JB92DRAFT_476024 [Gautieria morchelliformis]
MPRSSGESPFIPPMPSPYGTQRGVIPSPLSVEESLETDDGPSHLNRIPPRGPYPYGPYPAPMHTPSQWTPPGPWGPPGQGYPPSHGPAPGRLHPGTPWAGYQYAGYGPPPPHMYGYPPHPHSAPYPVGPLPSGGTPYHPIHGAPYNPYGYPAPYMPGSVPIGPAVLHPDDIGHPFPERPTEETIRIDKWAVGAHCKSFSLLRRCLGPICYRSQMILIARLGCLDFPSGGPAAQGSLFALAFWVTPPF